MGQYKSIDLFKFIFALAVVAIHTLPFQEISQTASWAFNTLIGNLAVPFFFVASGFLLQKRMSENKTGTVKKYVLHILKMYLVWCVIWLPLKFLNLYNIGMLNIAGITKHLFNVVFISGGDALWYLNALVIGTLLTVWTHKTNRGGYKILVIPAIFYIFGSVICSYYKAFENITLIKMYFDVFKTVDNGLFVGFVFTAIGSYIAQTDKQRSIKYDVVMFVLFFALYCAEALFIKNMGMTYNNQHEMLTLPVVTYYMFKIILEIKINLSETFCKKLRMDSVFVYLLHCYIIRLLGIVFAIMTISLNNIAMFFIVLVLSLILSRFIQYLVNKCNVRFLKILY